MLLELEVATMPVTTLPEAWDPPRTSCMKNERAGLSDVAPAPAGTAGKGAAGATTAGGVTSASGERGASAGVGWASGTSARGAGGTTGGCWTSVGKPGTSGGAIGVSGKETGMVAVGSRGGCGPVSWSRTRAAWVGAMAKDKKRKHMMEFTIVDEEAMMKETRVKDA
ncbi:hypothetical protein V2J09_001346 [Rumex salicifolius]